MDQSVDETDRSTVLVVHAEAAMASAYATTLSETGYDVRTVTAGERVRDAIDGSLEAILYSPRTPNVPEGGLAGLLDGSRCRASVGVLVAFESEPDPDDPFDERLTEPVPDEVLVEVVDRLVARARYDARLAECFELAQRVATLQDTGDVTSTEYRKLETRLRSLRDELAETVDDLHFVDRFDVAAGSRVDR